ncbi:sugar transferase [Sulfurimonas sp. SAG-AH-194-C20]|nr:sugar transferase [Sulfurimonas sp. SAG-AH-194-C20]MDF1879143.1 sugar transferase [Sulfurimonas sp. SAG-AH-194-C20]
MKLKRAFDFILAFILIVLFFPLFFIVGIVVYLTMGYPMFFKQLRPGYRENIFLIYKFRTMTDEKNKEGELLEDSLRLKGVGKFIRSLSIDELPQLFNVLKGEMSFVGPRPLLVEYLPLYNETQRKRHNVKPGITGWAQVNGRNAISWKEKFDYDVWYVENQSFFLDMQILWMTFLKVIKRSGISSSSNVSMEKFKGNQ